MTALFLLASPNLRAEQGNCGDNLTWTLDDQGTLTIMGQGAMYDYGSDSAPWKGLSFTTVLIGEGVTTIGSSAFEECSEMTSIAIPNTVTSIGEYAFAYCSGLTSVNIPNSVTSMGESAFNDCGLTSVNISNSLTSIGADMFAGCTGLESVTIPTSVTSIGGNAFYDCTGLKSVTIPNTVTSIGESAFRNCTGLESVTIPESVTSIGKEAFAACRGLESVTIPNSVTSIEEMVFSGCSGLTSVTIPSSVTSLGYEAFYGCEGLTKIESLAENPPVCNGDVFYDVDMSNCVLYVPKNSIDAYKDADEWGDFTDVKAAVTVVAEGNCGDNLTWTLDGDGELTIKGEGAMAAYTYNNPAPWASLSFTTAVIGEGVTTVGNYAFQDYSKLKSVTFPETLTSIGERAFRFCAGLTSVNFPSSLTNIGKDAFSGCTGLKKIESLAVTPPTCGSDVFSSMNKDNCVLYVPKNSAEAYKTADVWKEFTNIEPIANVVAEGNCGDNLTWTLDSEGVLTIKGTGSMSDYTSDSLAPWKSLYPRKVVIGDGVTTIGDYAFYECMGVTGVTIPSTVTSIGQNAFYYCSGLTGVDIPNSVTSIKESAFALCFGLTSVTIPASVTSIGEKGFDYCENLKSLTVSSSATSIGGGAFARCTGLEKIESLAETPPSCAANAFDDAIKNTCVLCVPKNAVGAYQSAQGWNVLVNTTPLVQVVQTGTCGDNVKWTLTDNGVLTIEGEGAMSDYASDSAPWKKLSFTTVVIGEGVTTIGNSAFGYYSEMTSITIPSTVTSIGEYAFCGCTGLESVTIPNSVTSIGESAFDGCGLTSVSISNSLTRIGEYVFASCKRLESVTIPASVTSIGGNAFNKCTGLTSLTIPNSVTSIGESAFRNCTGLESVTIPSSVTSLGYEAFSDCTGLTKIESLAENPPVCNGDVFYNVDKSNCVLYVPKTSVDAYKGADEWNDFTDIEAWVNVVASGDCGDNAKWTLDDQGVLTIKGTGAMKNYEWGASPFTSLSPKQVVIRDEITTVGDYAFFGCSGLTSVTIPNTVTSIGEMAFRSCEKLKSVTIPASVTSIGEGAFSVCEGLEEIESLAETPPTCRVNAFKDVDKNKCVLTVPKNSVDAYKAADQWKEFTNIATGISGVAQGNSAVVSASNGVITVTGAADNALVEVYSISGALVYSGTGKTVAVPSAGIYVVRAAGRTFKVNTAR